MAPAAKPITTRRPCHASVLTAPNISAAERIEDDISAASICCGINLLAQGVLQIYTRQVDDGVGAGRPNYRCPLGPGDRGEYAGAHRVRELHGGLAYPAGGAKDQHRFARLQPAALP